MESQEEPLTPEYAEALRWVESAPEALVVTYALGVVRDRLGMDAAYVSTVDSRQQTVGAVIGDSGAVGLITGTEFPIEQTYCRLMLAGEIPHVVPDTSAEPALRDLAATENIGSYIGVPVIPSDGRVHGTFCCASRLPRRGLGEAEVAFMKRLAAVVASRLDPSAELDSQSVGPAR
jgi:GAF domain-containing protein